MPDSWSEQRRGRLQTDFGRSRRVGVSVAESNRRQIKARRFLALNFHRSSFCRAHVNLKRASKLISSEDAFSVIMKQVNKLASFAPK